MRIGIDLGGTTVKAALCTEDGTLLCKDSLPTRTGNAAGLKADMKMLALSLCRAHGCAVEDVTAIGIGVPGSFDKKTCTLRFGTNLGLNNVSFADAFLPEFGCPVHLDNDANCAALGEATAGAAKGTRNMLMVTLGTGVGGGIIINGQLYTGCNGIAGEIGHMVIRKDGEPCNCGRRGCLEAYCSAASLVRFAERALEDGRKSVLAVHKGQLNAKQICDAVDAGDALAQEPVRRILWQSGERSGKFCESVPAGEYRARRRTGGLWRKAARAAAHAHFPTDLPRRGPKYRDCLCVARQ